MVKKAFTLIELVFAIVVMSIVMLSFPIIMQVDSDAREQSFAQEAVLAASAKMAQLFTFQWDEASLDWNDLAENIQTVARVLDGTGGTVAFHRIPGTELRPSGGSRHFFPNETNASNLNENNSTLAVGLDEQGFDFGTNSGFDAGFVAGSFGYKRDYQMDVKIWPVSDALSIGNGTVVYNDPTNPDLTGNNGFVFTQGAAVGQTNLRAMVVTIRDTDGNITRLYGYTANIGEYSAYSRIRP